MDKGKQRPRLGETAQDIYRNWQNARPGPGQIVVAALLGEGVFSWYGGRLVAHEQAKNGVATYRPATQAELETIDWAIRQDTLQIEARPVSGVARGQGGRGTIAQSSTLSQTVILHSPTGSGL